jgi:hypothetical protein
MMAQNDRVVVGIDVAKDKVDACIRASALRQTCPSTAQGHRRLGPFGLPDRGVDTIGLAICAAAGATH